MPPIDAFLSLGGNEESPQRQLERAMDHLAERSVGIRLVSSFYLTEPVGGPPQPWFVNAVVGVAFGGDPVELLRVARTVEELHGRRRLVLDGPRTLDIDLLVFGDTIVDQPHLTVPHPRLHERRFVLVPMVEIAPKLRHPVLGLTMEELLQRCPEGVGNRVVSLDKDGRSRMSPTA
jgi:2-amino-4-hydroxy-6-hydroxymethyldihydropteridine diphosphokinase